MPRQQVPGTAPSRSGHRVSGEYTAWTRCRLIDTKETPMSVNVGAKAPDFTLPNQDRESVTLNEKLKTGPVVLAFFPAAFSSVCQQEMCTFRDSMAELNKSNAQVLGVSTDTFFALKAWGDSQKLNFPLLSDYNKDVIRKYGVVNADMIGLKDIAKRAVFVIGTDGVVKHAEVLDDARNEPNYEKVKQALASA
jgi:glutaredoxin-dependent peroxiredoxin